MWRCQRPLYLRCQPTRTRKGENGQTPTTINKRGIAGSLLMILKLGDSAVCVTQTHFHPPAAFFRQPPSRPPLWPLENKRFAATRVVHCVVSGFVIVQKARPHDTSPLPPPLPRHTATTITRPSVAGHYHFHGNDSSSGGGPRSAGG